MSPQTETGDFDRLVRAALDDVAAVTQPAPDLADRLLANARAGRPAVVGLTGRQRAARWSMPLLAAAAVVVLAVGGVVTTVLVADHHHRPAPPGHSKPVVPPSTPAPPSAGSPSPVVPAPADARALTVQDVENATIPIPAWYGFRAGIGRWGCAAGTARFRNGTADIPPGTGYLRGGYQLLGAPAIEDVNGDGIADATVLLICAPHQPAAFRVLALAGRSGGRVQVIGDVIAPIPFSRSDRRALFGLPAGVRPGTGGTVDVRWTYGQAPNPADPPPSQLRGYRIEGGRFAQVAGRTRFPDDSADLSVTAGTTILAHGGTGAIHVTVHNAGPKASTGALLLVELHGAKVTATSNVPVGTKPDMLTETIARVTLPELGVGESWTVDVDVRVTGTGLPAAAVLTVTGGLQPDYDTSNSATQSLFHN